MGQFPGFAKGAQAAQGWGNHDPLSAHSTRARAIVAALAQERPQNWRAHHEIPFNVVATQPVDLQEAPVDAGWIMGSAENLAALPADRESYESLPNGRALPMHNGAHPNYDAMVRDMLAPIVDSHENMSPEAPLLRRRLDQVPAVAPGIRPDKANTQEDVQSIVVVGDKKCDLGHSVSI